MNVFQHLSHRASYSEVVYLSEFFSAVHKCPELQWSQNTPERHSSSFSDDRNAVPVHFWENGRSKLGPAHSAVVIRGARVTRLTLLMLIDVTSPWQDGERKLHALCEQLNVDFQQAVEGFRDFVDSTGTGAIPSVLRSLQTAINTIPVTFADAERAISAV